MNEIIRAGQGDIEPLALTLARAFYPDPVSRYLFPNDSRRFSRLRAFFRLQLDRVYLPKGEVYTTANRAAAALWLPPETKAPNLGAQVSYLFLALEDPQLPPRPATRCRAVPLAPERGALLPRNRRHGSD